MLSTLPNDAGAAMEALAAGLGTGGAFISFGNTQLARNFSLQLVELGRGAVGIGRAVAWNEGQYLRAGFWGGPTERLVYRVMRDGEHRAWVAGAELAWPLDEPGVYRVEVYRYALRVGPVTWNLRPWIFTNPNWVVRVDEVSVTERDDGRFAVNIDFTARKVRVTSVVGLTAPVHKRAFAPVITTPLAGV